MFQERNVSLNCVMKKNMHICDEADCPLNPCLLLIFPPKVTQISIHQRSQEGQVKDKSR